MATTLPKRAVRCSVHGLCYDPKLTRGCVRCRREGLVPREGPGFVPLLLSLLVLTLVTARLVTAVIESRGRGAPIDDQAPATFAAADPRLDPDRYREPIERLERALYPDTAAPLATLGGRAAQAGHDLAASVRDDGADGAAVALAAFAGDLSAADLDAYGFEHARDRWLGLRTRHFLAAPWLAGGPRPGGTDPVVVGTYLDLADAIDEVLAEAERTGVGEAWSERLRALEAQVPAAPAFDADSSLLLGFDELAAALASARSAAGDPADPEAWLRRARDHVTAGRSRLTDVLG